MTTTTDERRGWRVVRCRPDGYDPKVPAAFCVQIRVGDRPDGTAIWQYVGDHRGRPLTFPTSFGAESYAKGYQASINAGSR